MRWALVVAFLATLLTLGTASAMPGGVLEDLLGDDGGSTPGVPAPPPAMDGDSVSLPAGQLFAASLALTAIVTAGTKHVTRDNVLEHETRKQIHELLWETGSAHLRRIADALDLSTTNATWHLDKLAKAGLVGEVKENGYRMYYPKGGGRILREQCILSAQMQSDNAQAVVDYVSEHPGAHQREIARALEVNHGTARWHLSRLAEAGVLEEAREGRTTTYRLTERAEEVLSAQPTRPRSDVDIGQLA